MDEKPKNDTKALMAFFSTPEHTVADAEHTVADAEFIKFWKSLDDNEKEYYRNAEI